MVGRPTEHDNPMSCRNALQPPGGNRPESRSAPTRPRIAIYAFDGPDVPSSRASRLVALLRG
jgi:hypothetical protein